MKLPYLIVTLASIAAAEVRRYTFDIYNKDIAPDGVVRSTVLVNGEYPGTLITGNKGDTFEITLNNKLTSDSMDLPTAIHWHGLFQAKTSEDDGPAGVNQCSILPNNSYTYRFTVPDQAGTWWYHSHHRAQYVDGLKGALVIYNPEDPHKKLYDVDDASTILFMTDWYRNCSHDIVPKLFSQGKEPVPDSGLINGKGGNLNHVVTVTKGVRYRFRIINSSAMMAFRVSFDGHEFQVIEVDGVDHYPLRAKSLEIYPGQRYSVVLTANQNIGNYFIRTQMINGPSSIETRAILRYSGAPIKVPTSSDNGGSDRMKEEDLSPLFFDKALSDPNVKADVTINLKFTKTVGATGNSIWTINNVDYQTPMKPLLYNILRENATVQKDFLRASNVYVLNKVNGIVDLVIEGSAVGFKHPFHLHGHVFSVLDYAEKDKLAKKRGPVIRDVHHIGGSRETLRFRADNPGTWFLHCHIDWHLEQGLAVTFVEHPKLIRETVKPRDEWFQTCDKWFDFVAKNGMH